MRSHLYQPTQVEIDHEIEQMTAAIAAEHEKVVDAGRLTDEIIAQFNPQNPAASVAALLALRSRLAALASDPVVDEKRGQLDHILQACLGLSVETVVSQAEVVPGETMSLHHNATVKSDLPVRWVCVRYPGAKQMSGEALTLRPGKTATRVAMQVLPAGTPLSPLIRNVTPLMFGHSFSNRARASRQ